MDFKNNCELDFKYIYNLKHLKIVKILNIKFLDFAAKR